MVGWIRFQSAKPPALITVQRECKPWSHEFNKYQPNEQSPWLTEHKITDHE